MKAVPGFALCLLAFALPAGAAAPTFSRDVAPIVWNHCAGCHHAGEGAPFTLTSYEDVRKRAKQLATITHQRVMPPWEPEPGFGVEFEGDRRLTDAQIKVIQDWVAAGAPEGDPSQTPPLPKFPEGWAMGEPDIVVKLPEPFTL